MKKTSAIFSVICAAAMLTACGNDDRAELERLRAENESMKAQQTAGETAAAASKETEPETAPETSNETLTVPETEDIGDWDACYSDCFIRFEGANVVSDYNDEPVIVVEMVFRNESDKARSCSFTFSTDAYQDGVECDTAILIGDIGDKYDTGTGITDIKPGVELTVYKAYKLRDEKSDVVIEVKGLYDFDDTILFTQTYEM